jgi:hypothetical protein
MSDQDAVEIGDYYVEAFGRPHRVLHATDASVPHIDVYIWKPEPDAPSWMLMTGGRSLLAVHGARFELVQHLRPHHSLEDIAEAAEVLRLVALDGEPRRGWTFKPIAGAAFDRLGKTLRHSPTILAATFKRPA